MGTRMTKKTLLAGSIATALFSASVLAGPPSDPDNAILVMFKPGVSKQERQNIIHNQGASLRQLDEHGRDLKMRYVADGRIVKVLLPKGADKDTLIKRLSVNPAVAVAEPDYPLHALAT